MHNRYMTAKPGFFAKRVGSGYQNGWIFGKLPNGGIIFNPKIYVADFGPLPKFFSDVFQKKLQHNFPKMRGGHSPVLVA